MDLIKVIWAWFYVQFRGPSSLPYWNCCSSFEQPIHPPYLMVLPACWIILFSIYFPMHYSSCWSSCYSSCISYHRCFMEVLRCLKQFCFSCQGVVDPPFIWFFSFFPFFIACKVNSQFFFFCELSSPLITPCHSFSFITMNCLPPTFSNPFYFCLVPFLVGKSEASC